MADAPALASGFSSRPPCSVCGMRGLSGCVWRSRFMLCRYGAIEAAQYYAGRFRQFGCYCGPLLPHKREFAWHESHPRRPPPPILHRRPYGCRRLRRPPSASFALCASGGDGGSCGRSSGRGEGAQVQRVVHGASLGSMDSGSGDNWGVVPVRPAACAPAGAKTGAQDR